jgi:hypothetical protein
MKQRLTFDQEFQILMLVFDKVLWLGFGFAAVGLYQMIATKIIGEGIYYLIVGVIMLIIFVWMLVQEYHFSR